MKFFLFIFLAVASAHVSAARETPIEVLLDVIQPYPTFSEGVFLALRELELDL